MRRLTFLFLLLMAAGCIEGDYALYSLYQPETVYVEVEVPVEIIVEVPVEIIVEVPVEIPGEGGRFGSIRSNNHTRWTASILCGLLTSLGL